MLVHFILAGAIMTLPLGRLVDRALGRPETSR
jgi:hypothetical protein